MHILLSNGQAGPGRTVKQEQEEISPKHVQAFILGSVHTRTQTETDLDGREGDWKLEDLRIHSSETAHGAATKMK